MLHIVLEKANNVQECYESIALTVEKIEGGVVKITDKYLSERRTSALIECAAVENGKEQNFFIQLSSKGEAITLRLFPLTDPEKTKAVKTLMGMVANTIKHSNVNIVYGENNLHDFIIQ
jgi:hypothetical protein